MTKTRRILMVVFVATALAADRVATAAPAFRPQVVETARKFAGRLVVSFRRTIPAARFVTVRREGAPVPVALADLADTAQPVRPHESSPFQWRLPPPVV